MKKIISITIFAVTLLFSTSLIYAENISMNSSVVNSVIDVVEEHITKMDTGNGSGNYLNVDTNLKTYLSAKESVPEEDITKYNYSLDISLKDYQEKDSIIYMQLGVKADWNYVDDIDSGYGKMVEVLVDKETGKIINFYDRTSSFDIVVRGKEVDLSVSLCGISNEIAQSAKQTYLQSQSDAAISIEAAIERDEENLEERNRSRSTNSYTWIYHDDVVTWARNNYYKDEPSSGGSGVDYTDFYMPEIYAYDCTNFVSHALLAGDARVYDTGGSGISSTGWYCRDMNNRSSSWTGVINLHSFVTNNTTYGPGGYSMTWNYDYTSWEPGDIMQFHDGSSWGHSTVITNSTSTSSGVVPLVTGRTGIDWYNNNQSAMSIYGSNQKRILHLYNYY